jgi:hypothetical protein
VPDRWPLLGERARPFDGVRAAEDPHQGSLLSCHGSPSPQLGSQSLPAVWWITRFDWRTVVGAFAAITQASSSAVERTSSGATIRLTADLVGASPGLQSGVGRPARQSGRAWFSMYCLKAAEDRAQGGQRELVRVRPQLTGQEEVLAGQERVRGGDAGVHREVHPDGEDHQPLRRGPTLGDDLLVNRHGEPGSCGVAEQGEVVALSGHLAEGCQHRRMGVAPAVPGHDRVVRHDHPCVESLDQPLGVPPVLSHRLAEIAPAVQVARPADLSGSRSAAGSGP